MNQYNDSLAGDPTTAKVVRDRSLRSPEAFVSLQLEKAPFRDIMLNEFLEKKRTMAMILKNVEEADKLKRCCVQLFTFFNNKNPRLLLVVSVLMSKVSYCQVLMATVDLYDLVNGVAKIQSTSSDCQVS